MDNNLALGVVSLIGALCGVAVTWGAQRQTVIDLKRRMEVLEKDVKSTANESMATKVGFARLETLIQGIAARLDQLHRDIHKT
jgi:outer membrane murein-binding lipoprotein Lpp